MGLVFLFYIACYWLFVVAPAFVLFMMALSKANNRPIFLQRAAILSVGAILFAVVLPVHVSDGQYGNLATALESHQSTIAYSAFAAVVVTCLLAIIQRRISIPVQIFSGPLLSFSIAWSIRGLSYL